MKTTQTWNAATAIGTTSAAVTCAVPAHLSTGRLPYRIRPAWLMSELLQSAMAHGPSEFDESFCLQVSLNQSCRRTRRHSGRGGHFTCGLTGRLTVSGDMIDSLFKFQTLTLRVALSVDHRLSLLHTTLLSYQFDGIFGVLAELTSYSITGMHARRNS